MINCFTEEAHPEYDGSKVGEGLAETPTISKNDLFVNDDDVSYGMEELSFCNTSAQS